MQFAKATQVKVRHILPAKMNAHVYFIWFAEYFIFKHLLSATGPARGINGLCGCLGPQPLGGPNDFLRCLLPAAVLDFYI